MLAQLGPYLIDEELAEGGMARVFRARLRGLGGFEKQLVIKQIRPELAKDPHFVELFVREANTLVALSHPHIVQVYELGAAEGTYYLSMEYVEGATVARILQDGPLPPALAAHVCAQMCEALDYAHGRFGILHRDITPRNIIVDQAGHARLLDFGIATTVHADNRERFGSPGYMSPEQARGEALTPASDLFSLGCVLYEALTGSAAFEKTITATLRPAPPISASESCPPALAQLLTRLLAPSPEARPHANEAARILRGYLAQARPEGVLDEMQRRTASARPSSSPGEREVPDATRPHAPEGTARIEAKSIATSPVLTEILRSAPGLAPMPVPPKPAVEAHTRRIRERSADSAIPEARTTGGRSTRWMLKAWPILAVLSMGIALTLSARRAPTRDPVGTPARQHGPDPASSAKPVVPAKPAPEAVPPALTPEAPAADAGAPGEVKDPVGRGTLSINALPWAEVSIDGRSQGTTPLRKLKLRAGPHRIAFKCPPLGRSSELSIDLPRQGEARLVVDLNREPPRTFLDGAKEVR